MKLRATFLTAALIAGALFVAACSDDDSGSRAEDQAWLEGVTDEQLRWCALDAIEDGMSEEEARAECELPWVFTAKVPVLWGMAASYGQMGAAAVDNTATLHVTLNPDGTAQAEMTYSPEENGAFSTGGCIPGTTGGANAQGGSVSVVPAFAELTTRWGGTHSQGVLNLTEHTGYIVGGANIPIGETALTTDLTYTRDELSGTAVLTAVNNPIGCGDTTYQEEHRWDAVPRMRE